MSARETATLPFGRPLGEIIQFAYTVPDVDAALRLYVERFRVGPWYRRGPFAPPRARYRGEPARMTITLARAFHGDTMIELIQQHDDSPSVFRERIDKVGYGFHHWAIATRDIERDIERFAADGYPVAFEDWVPSGARIVYVDATAELPGMIELVEMNDVQEQMYARFHQAATDWDGNDPIREG